MTEPIILFDFDGTIADTHPMLIAILNHLADEFGYPPLSPDQVETMRGLSSQEIIRQSQVSVFKIPFLIRRAKAEIQRIMPDVLPINGMVAALHELANEGYPLAILTSNFEDNVRIFLEHQALDGLFGWVDAGMTIFGKHRMIQRVRDRYGVTAADLIYVGDETRDIDAAQRSGIPIVSVTWGFNTRDILEIHNPNRLIDDPAQLKDAIASLCKERI